MRIEAVLKERVLPVAVIALAVLAAAAGLVALAVRAV